MTKLTAFAAAALMAGAGMVSAGDTLPLNPNKSSQAEAALAALIGTEVAAGTIIAATLVGSLVVVTIAADDGTTTTASTSLGG